MGGPECPRMAERLYSSRCTDVTGYLRAGKPTFLILANLTALKSGHMMSGERGPRVKPWHPGGGFSSHATKNMFIFDICRQE